MCRNHSGSPRPNFELLTPSPADLNQIQFPSTSRGPAVCGLFDHSTMSALPHPSPQPPSSITQIIVRALRSHAQQDCLFSCYLFDLGISDESFGSSPCHIFVYHYSSRRYSRSYRDNISCFVNPVDGVALSWLKSYITNRQQRVVIDCASHSKFQCNVGCTSSFYLGSSVFPIHTNFLPKAINKAHNVLFYADHTSAIVSEKNQRDHFFSSK